MAIINSLAVGKAKKSMGGITYNRLKGQQIAKQKVSKTGSILPADQSTGQKQMKNIVMAYQLLAGFLIYITALRKSTESNYNAFVRGFKSLISAVVADSRINAVRLLAELEGLMGNSGTVVYCSNNTGTLTVGISNGGMPWSSDLMLRVAGMNIASGSIIVYEAAISEADWNANTAQDITVIATDDLFGAYVYSVLDKKCSNVLITEGV